MDNHLAARIFDQYAQEYQDKYMSVAAFTPMLDAFCSLIDEPHAKILDVACGPGNVARYLLDRNPEFQIAGIDISPNMVRLARINNPGANFQVMDCREIDQLKSSYQAVVCSFCLPYLTLAEAGQLLTRIAALLSPGGTLYLGTIEGEQQMTGYQTSGTGSDVLYTRYDTEVQLHAMLKSCGFKIIRIQKINQPWQAGTGESDLVLIAQHYVT